MGNRRERPKRLGKALKPAPDEEFTPEAMRAFAEQEALAWWQKNAPPEFKNLTTAKSPPVDGNA